ncbi:MFS transporter [Streptomyces sp. B-S-A6]|uniref:MFS transporter n=2 Tax=Streptomyces cavernicola TaxID=3043613 RepID=A0ABT6SLS7_9ACTN|nr:MFS transporter [Streptomyces sp. B-S-A6]MDI3408176.1 MFS transporter [Streptomyces sp. B-S-A6]
MSRFLSSTFRSLRVRNFRLFTVGQLVSVAGTWMMVVAQDWLVLSITDGSARALGLVTALQFTPLLLFTLYGGRLADRYDKRTLLVVANLASALLACGLGVITLTGRVQLAHICLFALGLGVVNAVEVPARMAFVGELVGSELLPNASALSAAYFNVARVAGPALAGALIAWLGTGTVMLLNSVSYAATLAALLLMRTAEIHRAPRPAERGRVRDGLRYTAGRRDLVVVLALAGAVGVFGMNFQLTLPLMAKTEFRSDVAAFGWLTSALAAGSLAAALVATARRSRPSARMVTGAALAFGAAETAAGYAPSFVTALALLALTGFTSIWFAQAANHRLQLGTAPQYKGRVLALYTLVVQGSTPIGAVLVGVFTDLTGARAGLVVGGLLSCVAAAAAIAAERTRSKQPAALAEIPQSPLRPEKLT